MKRKGDAHDTLHLFFKIDGVPPKMIMDRSKEQTLGSFRKKCQEMDCHIIQREPYSPWKLQAEETIKETKKGAAQKMVWAGKPKQIRDDAMELEAYVISNTDSDIYMLQGEVPETVMLGGTSNTSQLYKHGFYYWVMFRYNLIQYPDKNPVLDRYLGPAIDVGPEMTDNIMKGNGDVVHPSTYRGLKEYEWINQAHIYFKEGV